MVRITHVEYMERAVLGQVSAVSPHPDHNSPPFDQQTVEPDWVSRIGEVDRLQHPVPHRISIVARHLNRSQPWSFALSDPHGPGWVGEVEHLQSLDRFLIPL